MTTRSARPPVPVLLTVRELNLGGIERDVTKLAIDIDRARFTPHVASYHAEGMRYEELRRAGVPLLHLPVRSLKSPGAVRAALNLFRYIRRHRIRLVHAWDASATLIVPVARLARVPLVLSGVLAYRDLLDPKTHRQLRTVDRWLDKMVVNCEAMRDHLIRDEGFPADRIEIAYNGVDTSQFFPAPSTRLPELDGASAVVGALCALRPEKNLGLLQEAFARVLPSHPETRLLIVGSGPELPALQENARRLGIERASVFHPATAEVPRFLRMMDIFVLCSRSEAFSNALLEAVACGCACAGSDVGGTPEMLGRNGERGLLFPNNDAPALAACLDRLLRDAPLRRDLGRRAAEFARQDLSVARFVENISNIYDRAWGEIRE